MEVSRIIAENLKRLRTERNLSLGALAALCDVSKVMLSQIEKGETNPSINTIWKIASGLKVPYSALLELQSPKANVLSKSELVAQYWDEGHCRLFCYYASQPDRNFELFQLELDAGHSYTSMGHFEKGQEFIMVHEGCLNLTVSNQTYTLQKDDAINFSASAEHTYTACGSETLKAVIINFYPA